ncbi:hypothetical protein [Amycolatopsis suaedae]|uniref:OmpA-like domain-containing protein n=1 Tax=Amycolatopsis suaedae TaxID=2510978 RepID=A0A4Q7J0Z7_9PSEU|nr:hypothetical protein [Amycolatopsis suaedae]RZQ60489.1 hypothetical protein EWH70_27795 [Amycolatopsis suaedae]
MGTINVERELAQAGDAARKGHHGQARRILAELGGADSSDPKVLDLLARVHAQQGDLGAADDCWRRAQELDPSLPGPDEGRRRIAELNARRFRRRRGAVAVLVIVVAAAGVGVGWWVSSPAAAPAPSDGLGQIAADQRGLSERVDEMARTLEHRGRVLADVRTALAGSPVQVRDEQGGLLLVFPRGLFSSLDRLSPDGRAALADLAGRLRRVNGPLALRVIGHTENAQVSPSSGFTDNPDLALRRARVAAEEMASAGGLPLSGFGLAAGDPAGPPFPATEPDRNRTVTLLVHPA